MRALVRFLAELQRREPLLSGEAWASLVCGVISLALVLVDPRTILGIDPWIKPAKFFFSTTIYLWTLAWMLPMLQQNRRVGLVRWSVFISMVVEIVLISVQAARGQTSHFNHTTPLNAVIFSTMGLFILLNTVAVVVLLVEFIRQRQPVDNTLRRGIQIGLIIFLLGSLEAGFMLAAQRHTVGAKDGGEGLPFVNWSTQYGDLRVAHFLGIHAMQLIPIVAIILLRLRPAWAESRRLRALDSFSIAYVAVIVLVLMQALAACPLLALGSS